MRIIRSATAIGLGFLAAFGFAGMQPDASANSILIKTTQEFQPGLVDSVFGTELSKDLGVAGWRKVFVPASSSVSRALEYYKRAPGVVSVEPNYIVRAFGLPNDPGISKQYWVNITKAPQAWDIFKGQGSMVVAVIDTGVDYTHEDLKSKMVSKGRDFVNNDDDAMDDQGHGTHCAGLVGAATNNGLGGAGMGYNIRILPVKVLSSAGGGTADQIIGGIKYAADSEAKVLSMSLGGYGRSEAMSDAVQYAWGKNKIVVAAAGNDSLDAGVNPMYPANYDNVYSVAATNSSDQRAWFSNYSKTLIDVAAPGEDIYSTIWPGGGYANESGTSMACPITAGLVGLVWSYAPTAKPQQILDVISKTADNVGPFVKSGRINAFKAVDYFTVSVPISATLVGKSVFQGAAVFGTAPFMNIQSESIRNLGQAAGVTSVFRMPTNPVSQMRKATISASFGANAASTVQLFLWNYATSKYDLVSSVPGTSGQLNYSVDTLPTQYYDKNTRNYSLILRSLVPTRSGYNTASYVFPVQSITGSFTYRVNP